MADRPIGEEEIALIKAMLASGEFPKDQIQAFFTRPDRVLNFGRITDIERGQRGAQIEPASSEELARFLETWTPGKGVLPEVESDPFSQAAIEGVLGIDPKRTKLSANETDRVEFKQSWNAGHVDEYARSMAAFANNKGGYLVFGVRDGTGEIVGLSSNKFIEYDSARLSDRVHHFVQPQLDWDKRVVEICGKPVGLLYGSECHLKPIIGITDEGRIEDGAVYFRYPGETRRIRHADLMNLITERERRLSAMLSDQVARIAQVGPYDAAILDTSEGELEVSGRSLYLAQPLRDQIERLAKGEYGPNDETFELSGNVGVRGGVGGLTVIRGRVGDYDVLKDFIDRANVANPFDYIRHFLDTQTTWLPLFWYVLLYSKPIPQVIAELEKLPKLKPKSGQKLVDRLEGRLGRKKTFLHEGLQRFLDKGQPVKFSDVSAAIDTMRAISAIEITNKNEEAIFGTLANALELFDNSGDRDLFSAIRYAASFVDQQLYRAKCQDL